MVGGTGSKVADVGREEDTGYVCCVCGKLADGDDGGGVVTLDHAPYIDVALVCCISTASRAGVGGLTALFPAQTMLPSEATVTEATLTSSSGISW